jgi:hypothetical protein
VADEPEIAEGGEGTDVSLTELLEQVLSLTLQAMAGPVIGKVDAYDSAKNRVSITPLVPLLVAGEVVASPKLPAVPVAWPTLGSMSLKFPLLPGAFMELHPLGHDHGSWLTDGAEKLPPTNERRFSLSDLVAVPLTPSPLATPPGPTSYDAAWAVLFGQLKVGSSAASKAVGLHKDQVNRTIAPVPGDAMTVWMTTVETVCNVVAGGTFTPLNNAFSFTSAGTLAATAAKLKAE